MSEVKYRRVLLKLSGEVFAGEGDSAFDSEILTSLGRQIKEIHDLGVEVGIVVGGGNIWRFRDMQHLTFLPRVTSDTMGMLATVMNAMTFAEILKSVGVPALPMSSLNVPMAVDSYTPRLAMDALNEKKVVIFAGGTGSPFFTTDSAAALRAMETGCDVLLKATKVDFVYDKDPNRFADAVKFETLTYQDVVEKGLAVMDLTCAALCAEGKMPMVVFNLQVPGNILKAVRGEKLGTFISN